MIKEKGNLGSEFILQSSAPTPPPVNVLFTSHSSAGVWQIRGQQIAAIRTNWKAANKPSDEDLEQSDLICVVKKPDPQVIKRARQMGKPIVFDIVDSWAQPKDGMKYTDANQARKLFSRTWQEINVDGYIFPTKHMQDDLGALIFLFFCKIFFCLPFCFVWGVFYNLRESFESN